MCEDRDCGRPGPCRLHGAGAGHSPDGLDAMRLLDPPAQAREVHEAILGFVPASEPHQLNLDSAVAVRLDPARRVPQGTRRDTGIDVLIGALPIHREVWVRPFAP